MNKKLIVTGLSVASFLMAGSVSHAAKSQNGNTTNSNSTVIAKADAKCGSGTCDSKMKKDADAKCNSKKKDEDAKCGSGTCDSKMKKDADAKCNSKKTDTEAKCNSKKK